MAAGKGQAKGDLAAPASPAFGQRANAGALSLNATTAKRNATRPGIRVKI
jgi:hypothetical protein